MKTLPASNSLFDFELLLDSVTESYLILSKDFRILWANRAYLQTRLTTRGAIFGKNIFEAFPNNPADPAANAIENLRRSLERVLQTKQPDKLFVQQYDVRDSIAENGAGEFQERHLSAVNTPVFDAAGEIEYIIHRVEDETEFVQLNLLKNSDFPRSELRRSSDEPMKHEFLLRARQLQEANERLRESEQRFRNMADNAPVMIWITELDGACSFLSQSWYDFTGQTPETGLGFGWVDATHPDDKARAHQVFVEANENQQPFRVEYRLRRRNGEYAWAIDSATPRFGDAGEFLGYIGSVIDISERKESEEALRASEDRYRTLFNSIDTGFGVLEMLFDARGKPCDYRFIEINPAFEQQTGLRDAAGKRMLELVPNIEQHWIEIYGRVALTGEPARFANGSEAMKRWFDVYAFRVGAPETRRVAVLFSDVTTRKQHEKALLESDARLRLAIDISRTSTFEIDLQTDAVETDSIGREIYGFELDEPLTFSQIQARFHPEDRPEVERRVNDAIDPLNNADEFEVEQRIIRTDGELRWIRVRGRCFFTGDSETRQPARCLGTYIDITDSKLHETVLREHSEFNQNVLDSLAAHVAVLDKNGVITTVNQAWRQFAVENGGDPTLPGVGVGTNYLEACRVDESAGNDESAYIYQGINDVLAGAQKFFSIEYPCDSPTAKRWFLLTASPLTHDSGGVVVSHTNITKRRVAEESLRESEEKFRFLANSISQLAWMADRTGAIFWYNQRWFDYTGTTEREMHEQGWQIVAHPEEAERVINGFQNSIKSGAAWEETFRMRGANGDYRWFLSRALPIRGDNGETTRWFGTNTDVEELRQARKTAEEANRLKDEFLATVSHELRTPLNAILGWANLLRSGNLDAKAVARAIETIERNARSQAQLIEDLLDVSRIITGNLRLDVRPIEPTAFIEAALEAVRPAAESKGVRLQKIVDTGVPSVSGDHNRLQQVVWNLLSNAVKFTPRDGRVSISLTRVNSHLEIAVSDTGEGIAEDFLPFVFDRFRQADGTSTRRHGGLGLGLAIVRHIVELHGGAVSVASDGVGTGSTFTVKLPLVPVYQTEQNGKREHPAANENLPPLESAERLDAATILIVDDEPDARELLATVLRERGAHVATYASVAEIMHALKTAAPDVIVSDIEMPGEDGYEFIKKLRALPANEGGKIPAVALTAYARTEDRLRALRAGYQMHISKPVELNELVAVVASLVERAKTKF